MFFANSLISFVGDIKQHKVIIPASLKSFETDGYSIVTGGNRGIGYETARILVQVKSFRDQNLIAN
jgi:hypothetical protein